MDRILLNGLTFFGHHGCHAAENELGQKFIVDIALDCDLRAAGASDTLDDKLN
jgi:dihydroneopterin aldolase